MRFGSRPRSRSQRAIHHQAALNLALEMENAGRRIRDENVEEVYDALRDALRDLKPAHRLTSQKLSFLDNPDLLAAKELRAVREAKIE